MTMNTNSANIPCKVVIIIIIIIFSPQIVLSPLPGFEPRTPWEEQMTYQCATVLLYYFLFVVNKNLITVRFLFAHSETQLFLDIHNLSTLDVLQLWEQMTSGKFVLFRPSPSLYALSLYTCITKWLTPSPLFEWLRSCIFPITKFTFCLVRLCIKIVWLNFKYI